MAGKWKHINAARTVWKWATSVSVHKSRCGPLRQLRGPVVVISNADERPSSAQFPHLDHLDHQRPNSRRSRPFDGCCFFLTTTHSIATRSKKPFQSLRYRVLKSSSQRSYAEYESSPCWEIFRQIHRIIQLQSCIVVLWCCHSIIVSDIFTTVLCVLECFQQHFFFSNCFSVIRQIRQNGDQLPLSNSINIVSFIPNLLPQ